MQPNQTHRGEIISGVVCIYVHDRVHHIQSRTILHIYTLLRMRTCTHTYKAHANKSSGLTRRVNCIGEVFRGIPDMDRTAEKLRRRERKRRRSPTQATFKESLTRIRHIYTRTFREIHRFVGRATDQRHADRPIGITGASSTSLCPHSMQFSGTVRTPWV